MRKGRTPICYVDENSRERARFESALESHGFIVGTGDSLEDALEALRDKSGRGPSLIVLDLFLPQDSEPNLVGEAALRAATASYQAALSNLRHVMLDSGQDNQQALAYIERIKRMPRHTPVVIFSRKGTLDDARVCLKAGAHDVLAKPTPNLASVNLADECAVESAYDDVFKEKASTLSRTFRDAIAASSWRSRHGAAIVSFILGILASLTATWLLGILNWGFEIK